MNFKIILMMNIPIFFAGLKEIQKLNYDRIYGIHRGYLYFKANVAIKRINLINGNIQIIERNRLNVKVEFGDDHLYLCYMYSFRVIDAISGEEISTYKTKRLMHDIFVYENIINIVYEDKIVNIIDNEEKSPMSFYTAYSHIITKVCGNRLYIFNGVQLKIYDLRDRIIIGIIRPIKRIIDIVPANDKICIIMNHKASIFDNSCKILHIEKNLNDDGKNFCYDIFAEKIIMVYENERLYGCYENKLCVWRINPTIQKIHETKLHAPILNIEIFNNNVYIDLKFNPVLHYRFSPIFTNLRQDFVKFNEIAKKHVRFLLWIFGKFSIPIDIIEKIIIATI